MSGSVDQYTEDLFYALQAATRAIERPDVSDLASDWDTADAIVQHVFEAINCCVQARWPQLRSRAGRTRGFDSWHFSYFTFDTAADDPIVLGVAFIKCDHGWNIVAACSGENSGKIHFGPAHRRCLSAADIPQFALEAAAGLAERAAELLAILQARYEKST